MISKIKAFVLIWFWSLFLYLKYGKMEYFVEDSIDYRTMEASYRNELGYVVGYWATGHFDPEYHYRGQPLKSFCFVPNTPKFYWNGKYFV